MSKIFQDFHFFNRRVKKWRPIRDPMTDRIETDCIWHFLKKSGDKILAVSNSIIIFLTGFELLLENLNNCIELPYVKAHKAT